jgi:hypothetical protein
LSLYNRVARCRWEVRAYGGYGITYNKNVCRALRGDRAAMNINPPNENLPPEANTPPEKA